MSQVQRRALIVDDEGSVRYILNKDLGDLGYECTSVSSGEDAVRTLADQEFDLIMLDMKMPGMSGLDVLRKSRPSHPKSCIVILSALVDTEIAAQGLNLGADDYLTKPWTPDDLASRLRGAQEKREAALRDGSIRSPPAGGAEEGVDLGNVTEDLVRQQITLFERLTSTPSETSESPGRRRWWPWPRKS